MLTINNDLRITWARWPGESIMNTFDAFEAATHKWADILCAIPEPTTDQRLSLTNAHQPPLCEVFYEDSGTNPCYRCPMVTSGLGQVLCADTPDSVGVTQHNRPLKAARAAALDWLRAIQRALLDHIGEEKMDTYYQYHIQKFLKTDAFELEVTNLKQRQPAIYGDTLFQVEITLQFYQPVYKDAALIQYITGLAGGLAVNVYVNGV